VCTAKEIAGRLDMEIVTDAWLRERHIGVLQGLTLAEAETQQPVAFDIFASASLHKPIPGGGESLEEFGLRVRRAIDMIAEQNRGQRVVVVCHAGVISSLLRQVLEEQNPSDAHPADLVINASVNVLRASARGKWRVCLWADVSHLRDVGYAQGVGCVPVL